MLNNLKQLAVVVLAFLLLVSVVAAQDDDYEIPPIPQGIDTELVIGQVGDQTITLGDFVRRTRFERYRLIYRAFEDLIDIGGVEALDANDPNNSYAQNVRAFAQQAVNQRNFGGQVYDLMILERLIEQEAAARNLTVTDCEVNDIWARTLGLDAEFVDCEIPDGFEEAQAEFLAVAETYAGFSPDEVNDIFTVFALNQVLSESLREDVEIDEVTAVRTRHIRVEDEATANEVIERLEAGESFDDLLREYTIDVGIDGSQGDLGQVEQGQLAQQYGQPFETAVSEIPVGEVAGPIESALGFHVVEMVSKSPSVNLRHILVESESEARRIRELLEDGFDFGTLARDFSIDRGSATRSGNLGSALLGQGTFVPEFEASLADAQAGDLVGPFETEFGWHVVEVIQRTEGAVMNLRQIVVETADEAEEVLQRLEDGEDFGALAEELSLDPQAQGNNGDTLAIVTGGQSQGLYLPEETLPEFDLVVFGAEEGEILGPIATAQFGYFIMLVEEVGTRMPAEADIQFEQDFYVQAWFDSELSSDRVQTTELWRAYIPTDPRPSDVNPDLAPLDDLFAELQVEYQAQVEATDIINILSELTVPPDLTEDQE